MEPGARDGSETNFATTHWSLVLRAGKRSDHDADEALSSLCRRYWFPLYAYYRRRLFDETAAQDLTQEFFARLLEKEALAHASPERGRFRAFLLTAAKNFLAGEWERAGAQKRGGWARHFSFDGIENTHRYEEPSHDETPERLFDRQWAMTLLNGVMEKLQNSLAAEGKERQFALLKPALTGQREHLPYAELAEELGMTVDAARKAASRLRQRYRDLLRAEVAQTVAEPGEVENEIRDLFEILGN